MDIPENVLRAIDKIFDGNCVLFTGAGFSMSAKSLEGEHLKSAEQLKNHLFVLSNMDTNGTLDWAVENYIETFSEREFISLLRSLFLVKEIQPEQKIIAEQNWKGFYTTNYDNLIETVFSDNHKQVRSTTITSKPSFYSNKRDLIVHINGFIENLNEDDVLPKDFLLSEISYVTSQFINSEWFVHLQSDLITSDAIFFIGFSMRTDLDIERIVFNSLSENRNEKVFFVVRENEPSSSVKFLSKFGTVLPVGVNEFSEIVKERKSHYVPSQNTSLRLFSFKEFSPNSQALKITTTDVFDLLFFGKFNQAHIESSINNPLNYKYYFPRKVLNNIIKSIIDGNKNIVITSDLGNGKSMLIEGLKVLLHDQNYKIFHFQKWYDQLELEIQKICEKYPSAILIIENYNQNIKILDFLQTRRGKDIIVITSERSAVHDTTAPKLEKYFGDQYFNYDLDRLDDIEISNIVAILNEYGLWGDYSNLIDTEKSSLVKNRFNGSLRVLLLRLIESKSILDRFKEIINSVAEKKNYFEAIVLILSANLFSISLEIDQLISILNDEKFRKPNFKNDPAIRELIDFSSNSIKVKSSILSEAILTKASNAHSIVQALLKICKQIDLWSDDETYKSLLREYVSFSNIHSIIKFDTENYANAIDYYFDELRNLRFCKENPHYWLQYGILNLEKNQFELAKKQFETAYSFAKRRPKFDTYQLDNQFARYLLLFELKHGTSKSCMISFREAHQILTNNLSPNRLKYYPYKVAQLYIDIYNAFFKQLKDNEKSEFIQSLKEMNESIGRYIAKVDDHRIKKFVLQTQSLIKDILSEN